MRDERDRARELAEAQTKLADAGVRLVEQPSYGDKSSKRLAELVADAQGSGITPAKHKNCPGHAAYVHRTWSGRCETVYVCTDWKANGHRPSDGAAVPAAALTPAEREQASAERRQVRENNSAWRSAETVRRSWLRTFLARKAAPKGSAAFVAVELAHNPHELSQATQWAGNQMLCELLGLKGTPALRAAAEKASEGRALVLTLGFVLAAYEAKTGTHTWRSNNEGAGRYLAFLAAQGYELSDVERLCLPRPATRSPRTRPAKPTAPAASQQSAVSQQSGGQAEVSEANDADRVAS